MSLNIYGKAYLDCGMLPFYNGTVMKDMSGSIRFKKLISTHNVTELFRCFYNKLGFKIFAGIDSVSMQFSNGTTNYIVLLDGLDLYDNDFHTLTWSVQSRHVTLVCDYTNIQTSTLPVTSFNQTKSPALISYNNFAIQFSWFIITNFITTDILYINTDDPIKLFNGTFGRCYLFNEGYRNTIPSICLDMFNNNHATPIVDPVLSNSILYDDIHTVNYVSI